jgi:pimeloyl-ACP methyl ester carboxylesterase
MNRGFVIATALGLLMSQPAAAETVRTNGVELEYQVSGTGEPLVLLHGFGDCIEGTWGALIPELSKTHRVIAVNMRGHGGSTNPSNSFSHAQSAEDVRGLLDALGVAKARAIGFSSGGMTLLHLATRHPERLSKMVVVGATTHFGDQARRIMRSVASEGLPPTVQQEFAKCAPRGDTQVKELVRQFGAFKDSRTDMNFQPADLAKIKAETLILHGDRDEFFPVSIPVGMYGAIPKAQLWIVPGGSHQPTAGASKAAFLETVGKFLAK